jgi:hypothetical protein
VIVSVEKPGTPAELVHHGVKGMKWGVRKERSSSSRVKGSEHFHRDQAKAVNTVSDHMKRAYGHPFDEVVPIKGKNSKYIAYVERRSKDGRKIVHVNNNPNIKADLQGTIDRGWFVPAGNHPVESNFTHEAAHSYFHQRSKGGKALMDDMRKSAWDAAQKQAIKDKVYTPKTGIKKIFGVQPEREMAAKLSKYAEKSIFIEETEAEIFSAYHWSPNPPKFVDAFMNDIHTQLGNDVQPFSGRKVSRAA